MNTNQLKLTHMLILICIGSCTSLASAQTTAPSDESTNADTSKQTQSPGPFNLSGKTLTNKWLGHGKSLEEIGLKLSLSYQQQSLINFHGGKDTNQGQRSAGSYDLTLKVDFKKLGLWEGGYAYIKAKGNWQESVGLNRGKIGALSKPNSDEKEDDSIYISKWWIGQKFLDGKIDLRIGRIETKKDLYDRNAYASHEDKMFLNSWLVAAANAPHTTAMGAHIKVKPTDWLYLQMGAFDGDSRGSKRGGLRTTFHDSAHFIAFWEFGLTPTFETSSGPLSGNYRFGWWYDGRPKQMFIDDLGFRRPRHVNDDVGFYLSFDQQLLRESDDPDDKQGLGMFFRYAFAHEEVNRIEHFWSIGAQYRGLIPSRNKDVLAFGVAQGILSDDYKNEVDSAADRETVYELYYAIEVAPWLIITPDIQYIKHPGGDDGDKDSIVGGIRLRVLF